MDRYATRNLSTILKKNWSLNLFCGNSGTEQCEMEKIFTLNEKSVQTMHHQT